MSCNQERLKSILRGNYENVLRLSNSPLIVSRQTNVFAGGFDNGIMFRNSIYTVTGYQGYTYCNLHKSIIVELNQSYELNTLVFWLWDRSWRTYDLVVYASYEDVETVILDSTAVNGIVSISFPDQLVKKFRIYNRNGSTANQSLIIIKAEAFYKL